jgi:RNA polymerase sigma-70 factor, ECF subfamily
LRLTEGSDNPMDRFRRLAWPQLATLLRTARYLTRDESAAEDLVQETMIRAMKKMDTFKEGTDIRAWLMTILRRTHIDLYRANRKHENEISLDAANLLHIDLAANTLPGQFDDRWDDPDDLMQRFEDQTIVLALKTMPEDIRWTLLLVDVEQLDHAEAAEVLGVPVGTIKSRAHRGRAMLRDRLHAHATSIGLFRGTGSKPS